MFVAGDTCDSDAAAICSLVRYRTVVTLSGIFGSVAGPCVQREKVLREKKLLFPRAAPLSRSLPVKSNVYDYSYNLGEYAFDFEMPRGEQNIHVLKNVRLMSSTLEVRREPQLLEDYLVTLPRCRALPSKTVDKGAAPRSAQFLSRLRAEFPWLSEEDIRGHGETTHDLHRREPHPPHPTPPTAKKIEEYDEECALAVQFALDEKRLTWRSELPDFFLRPYCRGLLDANPSWEGVRPSHLLWSRSHCEFL